MKHYVGLDVSLKEVSICVVDADGVVAAEGKVLDRRQDDAATPRAKSCTWPSAPCGPGVASSALRIAPTVSSAAGACPRGD